MKNLTLSLFTSLLLPFRGIAFVQRFPSSSTTRAASFTTTTAIEGAMQDVELLLIENNGDVAIEQLEALFKAVENQNAYKEPNREAIYKGTWHVWYSNAPPPSNGQLGPFQGSAEQAIAGRGDSYKNILRLPPNSKDDVWLTVVLDGIWEDWDGIEIIADGNNEVSVATETSAPVNDDGADQDWGAKFWKVTFLTINFSLFGKNIFSQKFPAGVSRVWRTTYLDNDTRIVRAGRTGRVEDESVFYMKRSPRPLPPGR